MALITCPECGNAVSTAAAACPKCGLPFASSSGTGTDVLEGYWYAIIWCSLLIPLLGAWVIIVVSSIKYYAWRKEFPNKAKTINRHGWLAWLAGNIIWIVLKSMMG